MPDETGTEITCKTCQGRLIVAEPGFIACPHCGIELIVSPKDVGLSDGARDSADMLPPRDAPEAVFDAPALEEVPVRPRKIEFVPALAVARVLSFVGAIGVIVGAITILSAMWQGSSNDVLTGAVWAIISLILGGYGLIIELLAKIEGHLRERRR